MAEKGIYSPVVRRLITAALFVGITGTFISMYYLVFLPQQHADFNLRTFRILHEITSNFSERLENFRAFSINRFFNTHYLKDTKISIKDLKNSSPSGFANTFKGSFKGNPSQIDSLFSSKNFISLGRSREDTLFSEIRQDNKVVLTEAQPLNEILEPLIAIYPNTFEAVLLVKQIHNLASKEEKNINRYDSILYKSANIDIANIDVDSLFNNNLEAPVLRDVDIKGITYKMFLIPFKMRTISDKTFVLAGIISEKKYRQQSQAIPVDFIIVIGVLLILLLLALPFLKIYVLSVHENITIDDVRLIIAIIFIIPIFVTLICTSIFLYNYPDRFSKEVLSSLQNEITDNFYNEIKQEILQAKHFDSILNNPPLNVFIRDSGKVKSIDSLPGIDTIDIKDFIFYPQYYKNIENVHWMDVNGNDIAAWNFLKKPATYFKLSDRPYFRDIRYNRGYSLPGSSDTFSLYPTLSRLTGDYTINIAIPAHVKIADENKVAVTGLSGKMYSLYNTVLPAGYGYCLIDENGEIMCHSDNARSLRENLFEETSNNQDLLTAVNHKDSVLINNIDLYNEPVKMMVKPLDGLPYYLVTYYRKRGEYLFTFHVVAFVFVCESILLLFVSLFSYCIMISGKRMSKLFFVPGSLKWLKPSPCKVVYYKKNYIYLIISVLVIYLFSHFISAENTYIYGVCIAALLPLFSVTGYYIIKRGQRFIYWFQPKGERKGQLIFRKKLFSRFLFSIKNALFLYISSILLFSILQHVLFFNHHNISYNDVTVSIWILIVLLPIIMFIIAGTDFKSMFSGRKRTFVSFSNQPEECNSNYLNHFLISLLVSVAVICVIPAITLTAYAFHEEKNLHLTSFQVDLAKKIQQRRTGINSKQWQTKVLLSPEDGARFIDSLKFYRDKGLYLHNNILRKEVFINSPAIDRSSPFYKIITKFLFLPPDHNEFYDDTSHNTFYYWKKSDVKKNIQSLQLHYKNLTDHRNPDSFSLTAEFPKFSLFNYFFRNYLGLFVLLSLLMFLIVFYRIIYSVATRIFLVGYFVNNDRDDPITTDRQDREWVRQKYNIINLCDFCKTFSIAPDKVSFAEIRKKERILLKQNDGGEGILKIHLALVPVYENIWKDCTDTEKYTLYDFALDGFTNYKRILTLYGLYNKGLLIKDEDDNLTLMTQSFRNFLITKETSEEIRKLSTENKGSWAIVRTVFYIIIIAVAVFIFISQEEASKRLIAIITSLGALLPAMLKLFDKGTFNSPGNKSSS
ncbi:hypothetical protein [Segetibacter koreensis]|uniref:hypothetical protein n=1 Tax=Segetibacter koreensis TaxID=398037 RepID=UPI00036BC48F|nr:hypothetical protein [Segetibacter koreensis]